AKGGAMHASGHAACSFLGCKAGADRETATQALGKGHDIRRYTRPFMGQELARAADSGLHLIEDQEQPVLVTERTQPAQRDEREPADAALALHGLNQDGRSFGADCLFYRRDIVERHLVEAFGNRAKTFQVLFLAAS